MTTTVLGVPLTSTDLLALALVIETSPTRCATIEEIHAVATAAGTEAARIAEA